MSGCCIQIGGDVCLENDIDPYLKLGANRVVLLLRERKEVF